MNPFITNSTFIINFTLFDKLYRFFLIYPFNLFFFFDKIQLDYDKLCISSSDEILMQSLVLLFFFRYISPLLEQIY